MIPTPRRLSAIPVAITAILALLVSPSAALSPLLTRASAYDCATVPSTVAAPSPGAVLVTTARLDRAVVTYRAVVASSTTVPSPGLGLPYPGTLRVSEGGHSTTLPAPSGFAGSAVVQLCALADGARPAVLLGGYSGGAHCCFLSTLYAPSGRGYRVVLAASIQSVRPAVRYDPNEGMVPAISDGALVLESADGTFAYEFGCYACTPTPLTLYQLRGTRLVEVARRYPALMRANRASLALALRQSESPANAGSIFGVLAAYVAESCTLGSGRGAWALVTRLERRGLLGDAAYHQAAFVTRGSYVPTLRRVLLQRGYCRGVI